MPNKEREVIGFILKSKMKIVLKQKEIYPCMVLTKPNKVSIYAERIRLFPRNKRIRRHNLHWLMRIKIEILRKLGLNSQQLLSTPAHQT